MLCTTSNSHPSRDHSVYALRISISASGLTVTVIPNMRYYQIIERRQNVFCQVRSGHLVSTFTITGLALFAACFLFGLVYVTLPQS
jgi:hypothetical protein